MNFTTDIENFVKKIRDRYTSVQVWAFMTVLLVGILTHGYIIFNRISYHDNTACLFSLGATYELGRWGLGIIYDLQLLTTRTFSVPVFNGFISMILIGFSAMKMVDIFELRSKVSAVAVGAIMIVYPVVPSIFSFMFTSWPYFLGLLLSVEAAAVLVKHQNVKGCIGAAILLTLSLSMYQAFFAVTISIYLIKLLQDVIEERTTSVAGYAKQGVYYLVSLTLGLGLWSVTTSLFKKLKGIDTMDYKGMGEGYDIAQFPGRLVQCIREFFGASYAGVNGLRFLRLLTLCIIIMTVFHIVVLVIRNGKNIGVKLSAIIGAILLPVGMNVMYILSTSEEYYVDSLMVYGTAFVLILPVILIETLSETNIVNTVIRLSTKTITWLEILAVFVIAASYVYLDNAAYMKADIAQQQTTSYFTQLVANIKACEGFSDDMEIVFVNMDENQDGTFVTVDDNEELAAVKIDKFPVYSDLVTYGSAINYMQEHCGFGNDLVSIDDGTMENDSQVKAMPAYPDDGSIAVINNKIVVKFGE